MPTVTKRPTADDVRAQTKAIVQLTGTIGHQCVEWVRRWQQRRPTTTCALCA